MSSVIGRLPWPLMMSIRRIKSTVDVMFSPRYLLLTNTALSVGLSGLGDLMQQKYEIMQDLKKQLDCVRFRNLCITGLAFGPLCHYWYLYLDYLLPTRTTKSVIKKIAMDCCIMGPISVIAFLGILGILENKSKNDIVKDWSGKGLQILIADLAVWPPTEFISFKYLPLRYRVFYDNAVSLSFDNYYSYIMYRQDLLKKKEISNKLKQSGLLPSSNPEENDCQEYCDPNNDELIDENNMHDICCSTKLPKRDCKKSYTYVGSHLSNFDYGLGSF